MAALEAHDWPGNVSELEHVIERAVMLCRGAELTFDKALSVPIKEGEPESETMAEIERAHILRVLEAAGWRIAGPHGAAGRLGLKSTTLESRMKKLGFGARVSTVVPLSADGFRHRHARSRMRRCGGRFAVRWPLEACPCRVRAPRRRR